MSMLKFFRFPFAAAGDKTPIPDPSQVTGSVSYAQGFGPDYELDPLVDPDGKDVPRDETNQLFFDVTNAIREYQTFGVPDFITSTMNGGTPFAYARNARVVWTDGEVYESRLDANTDVPTVTASWRRVSGVNANALLIAIAGGTANALTATFSPSLTALVNGQPLFVRIAAPNTTTNPTLNVDGLGAKTIVKGANIALAPGDLAGSGFWAILQYDVTLDRFVLANPALGAPQIVVSGDSGWMDIGGGVIRQWGVTGNVSTSASIIFPRPFTTRVHTVSYGGKVSSDSAQYNNVTFSNVTLTGMTFSSGTTATGSGIRWQAEGV